MSALKPPENQTERGQLYTVLRRDPSRMGSGFNGEVTAIWEQVGTCIAPDPGTAFRKVVLRPGEAVLSNVHGEYMAFGMDNTAHIAAELHLRDLEADDPTEQVAP